MKGVMEEHFFIFLYMILSLILCGFISFSILYVDSEIRIGLEKSILSSTLYFLKKIPEGSSIIISIPKINDFDYSIVITKEKIIMKSEMNSIEYNATLNVSSTYHLLAGRRYLFKKINGLIIIYEVKK